MSITYLMNKTDKLLELLEINYPDSVCALESGEDPFRLLIMAILSAQTTDRQVNRVAPGLFERFPTPLSMAESVEGEIEELIKSVGFFNSKAKNLRKCCRTLCDEFSGQVPSEMDDLLKLAGVGRKVANLVRGDIFGLGGIVADTHLIRISNRLGLVDSTNPLVVEKTLDPLISKDRQSAFCHRIVLFGRDICSARSPKCVECYLKDNNVCEGINI